MKKLLLILMLAVVSSSAMAEWVEIVQDDEETFIGYVDPTAIRKNGNNVKMWVLYDHKKAQELPFLPLYTSVKTQIEYDCKEEKTKALYASYHAKNMGGGEVIYEDNNPENWSPVPPGSIDEILWKFACEK